MLKRLLITTIAIVIISFFSLLMIAPNPLHNAIAASPSFELQQLVNENHRWVQTYGKNAAHLKSNYTDILAVDYVSNGKTLNATFWLSSGFDNSSASVYTQPSRKITYGMLINVDSNTKTGYNGADYDFYIESVAGKLSGYLYQLSSTGGYRLVGSKVNFSEPFNDPNVLRGSINLQLDLGSLNYPSRYNVLFYTAESLKSDEVRQFTNWVIIPPPSLQITTSPSNVMVKQGDHLQVPARIKSTSGFSNDVVNLTTSTSNNKNEIGSSFNFSELHFEIQRVQPPLFKITVPQQTPLGIYSIPLIVTVREPSVATLTKPISNNSRGGTVDPEFDLSKRFPTVGYLTHPLNLTITVIPPSSISDQFREFWGVYGAFIGIFAGAFVGAFAKVVFDKRKKGQKDE
jgi:hypothetical protein